ncbi:hypothetical protein ACQPXT_34275 [Streptomyces sp. CA-100214]
MHRDNRFAPRTEQQRVHIQFCVAFGQIGSWPGQADDGFCRLVPDRVGEQFDRGRVTEVT